MITASDDRLPGLTWAAELNRLPTRDCSRSSTNCGSVRNAAMNC